MSSATTPPRFKVLFCGEEFPAGCRLVRRLRPCVRPAARVAQRTLNHPRLSPPPQTRQELAGDAGIEVVSCSREAVADQVADADVLVPLMCRMDEPLLLAAKRAKLVIQYGVGLEVRNAQHDVAHPLSHLAHAHAAARLHPMRITPSCCVPRSQRRSRAVRGATRGGADVGGGLKGGAATSAQGVDIDAATRARIPVSNIPAEKTGNGASCAEVRCFPQLIRRPTPSLYRLLPASFTLLRWPKVS
jgi:hypothetical protein